jgi:saccharopine dehydrogenase (NAD+, L-lysine-forming)
MKNVIAVRRETKSLWERRAAVTPDLARRLISESRLQVLVQPSARRVFPDNEYVRAGARLTGDISEADVVVGVKEIPLESFQPETTYIFFSHVIKGQPYNMPMLAKIIERRCTLIDYETIVNEAGQRLIFFGRYAGLAGMIDTLWALGQRLHREGITTPLAKIEQAVNYPSLDDAKRAVRKAGEEIASKGLPKDLPPVIIGISGYGNVAAGAREILAELPTREVAPDDLESLFDEPSPHCLYQTTFREEHIVEPAAAGAEFELQDYYDNPESYRPIFERYLPRLTALVNCIYWDARYPRLVTVDNLRELYGGPTPPRLKVIGDLSCDIEGAIQCTVKSTEPADPVYVYNPADGSISSGVDGRGPIILAVEILPAELPREASEEFSKALAHFLPALAAADFSVPFDDLDLPPELKRAVIVHRGRLTPDYTYLEEYLAAEVGA